MKILGALFVVLVLFVSCVTYRLQPLETPGKDQGALAVKANALWAPEIEFQIKVTNKSQKTLTVDSDKFRLYVGENDIWTEIPLPTSEEYLHQTEAQLRSRPTVTIVSRDAPVYRQTTSTTTILGSGGSVTIVRRRPVLQPVETRTVTILPSRTSSRLEWLEENLFYSVELKPGEDYTGLVYGRIGRGTHYKLVLPVDGKDYEVVFERIKERTSPFMNLD